LSTQQGALWFGRYQNDKQKKKQSSFTNKSILVFSLPFFIFHKQQIFVGKTHFPKKNKHS
jgi:hypothetical protein